MYLSCSRLVDEVLHVLVGQLLAAVHHPMKVSLAQGRDDVDVVERAGALRLLHVIERDQVLMIAKVSHELRTNSKNDQHKRLRMVTQSCLLAISYQHGEDRQDARTLISLRMRLASTRSAKAFGTFLMATFFPVLVSSALTTTP